jgi:hypothetical protein
MVMAAEKTYGYSYNIDRAINALLATSRGLLGDTKEARELIIALCDQAGASLKIQRAIEVLLEPESEEAS